MKSSIGNVIGCLIWVVLILAFWGGCEYHDYLKAERIKEQKFQDSIRKALVKDSLAHDPLYQDSLRKAKMEYEKWNAEEDSIHVLEVIGFMLKGDSVYHTCVHCIYYENRHRFGFTINDIGNLRFITKVDSDKYKMCIECMDIEDTYDRYQEGELFSEEDAKEHDLIPIDEADEYASSNYRDEKEW